MISVWGIELDLIQCRDANDLVVVRVVKLDLVFERGVKIICIQYGHAN